MAHPNEESFPLNFTPQKTLTSLLSKRSTDGSWCFIRSYLIFPQKSLIFFLPIWAINGKQRHLLLFLQIYDEKNPIEWMARCTNTCSSSPTLLSNFPIRQTSWRKWKQTKGHKYWLTPTEVVVCELDLCRKENYYPQKNISCIKLDPMDWFWRIAESVSWP